MADTPPLMVPQSDMATITMATNFSPAHIKQWYKDFMKDNATGQLGKRKFVELYSQLFSSDNADELCERVFNTYDWDKSGTIDFKEFMIAIKVVSSGTVYDKLWLAFSIYDINDNGSIDQAELLKMITTISLMKSDDDLSDTAETAKELTERIFTQLDTDHDGKITRREFVEGCMNDEAIHSLLAIKPY